MMLMFREKAHLSIFQFKSEFQFCVLRGAAYAGSLRLPGDLTKRTDS
jgi:hypothetical protein